MTKSRKSKAPLTPLAKRLARVMEEMGWTQSEMARKARCPRQTVSSWMRGDNENMQDANHAMYLQAESKFNAVWIMTGKGPIYVVQITPAEERLLAKYREAPDVRKSALELILGID